MVYGRYTELVLMGLMNQHSHHWGAPSCTEHWEMFKKKGHIRQKMVDLTMSGIVVSVCSYVPLETTKHKKFHHQQMIFDLIEPSKIRKWDGLNRPKFKNGTVQWMTVHG